MDFNATVEADRKRWVDERKLEMEKMDFYHFKERFCYEGERDGKRRTVKEWL